MVYSVFDWMNGRYRVYQDNRTYPIMSDPKSCAPTYRNAIGVDVSAALCAVPSDARFNGWSDVAQGQVSRLGAAGGGHSNNGGYSRGGPDLGTLGFLGPGLGQVPVATAPLALHEAVIYSTIISIASGLISAWFFKNVRVPIK